MSWLTDQYGGRSHRLQVWEDRVSTTSVCTAECVLDCLMTADKSRCRFVVFFDNTFPHTVTLFWQQTTDNQQFHFSHTDDDQRLRHTHRDTINHFTTVQSRLYVDSGTDYSLHRSSVPSFWMRRWSYRRQKWWNVTKERRPIRKQLHCRVQASDPHPRVIIMIS